MTPATESPSMPRARRAATPITARYTWRIPMAGSSPLRGTTRMGHRIQLSTRRGRLQIPSHWDCPAKPTPSRLTPAASVTDPQPSLFTSTPPSTNIPAGGTFSYTITAQAPNNPLDPAANLKYTLLQDNSPVYFVDNGDGTATVSWTPPVQTPGTQIVPVPVSYTHLRAHETGRNL